GGGGWGRRGGGRATASRGWTKNCAVPRTPIAAFAAPDAGRPAALHLCSGQPAPSGQAAPCPFGTSAGELASDRLLAQISPALAGPRSPAQAKAASIGRTGASAIA